MKTFLDDALIVARERQAGGVVGARPPEVSRLDLERVVTPAAGLVEALPATDDWARQSLARPLSASRLD